MPKLVCRAYKKDFNAVDWMRSTLCLLVLLLAGAATYAQIPDTAQVKKLLNSIDSYNSKLTPENLYLNFDKPYYAAGDTIWFKVYLLNAATRKASTYSNKVYVDLISDSSTVMQTLVIPVFAGLGQGDIKLNNNLREGGYTIRAYTNWMQNFGEVQFFKQRFYIGKPAATSWLVNEQHTTGSSAQGKQVTMGIRLQNLQGQPAIAEAVTMRVLEGRKSILKNDLQTGVDGMLNANFTLPPKTNMRKLSLLIEDKADKTKKITSPFYARAASDIDLQFMPEGGSLIAGLYNRFGFKAIGEDGLGTDVEGRIVDSKNQDVVTFKSTHNGMGSVALVPATNETYTAKIKLTDGTEKSYNLPIAKPSGLVFRADAVSNADTLKIYLTATTDNANANYTLLAQGRGTTYFGTSIKMTDGVFNTRIPKNRFPTGIVNFTVLDGEGKQVNSRNVFIDGHDRLNIAVNTDKPVYALLDSIAVDFKAADFRGNPIQANFSVTVTDDGQVKNALRDQHILSYFLLLSELKGHIENPDWYFDAINKQAPRALDNLMLTQGWIGINIDKITAKAIPEPTFWAETDNSVEGKLTNFFNKPAANRQVTLMNNRHGLFVVDTVSDAGGKFKFNNLPFSDTVAYSIKIHKDNGSKAAVGISVNEFKPAAPPAPDSTRLMPWYANTDSTLLNYLKTNQKQVAKSLGPVDAQGHLLKEVNIKDRKKASQQGLFGEDIYFADADINEKELASHGNISLLTYLEKNVRGFGTKSELRFEFFAVNGNFVYGIYIDSMSLMRYYLGGEKPLDFARGALSNMPSAGVKNVVIFHKPITYINPFDNSGRWISYIFIKTRSGNGPILKNEPGTYVYRPLPLYLPRDFYRPRYTVKTTQPDLRSTIHWQPNLVTDAAGHATTSFYAANKPGTYTLTIEGTDMQGHFGVTTSKVTISQGNVGGK